MASDGSLFPPEAVDNPLDLTHYIGQEHARRAMEVACAGGHRPCLIGSPGAGKTLLVECFEQIQPGIKDRTRTGRPCPCGYYGDVAHKCTCSIGSITAFQARNYRAHLDGFDMVVEVSRLPIEKMMQVLHGPMYGRTETSANVKARIEAAQAIQAKRGVTSADMSIPQLVEHCKLDAAGMALVERAAARLGLSMRVLVGILKVGRTIADLAGADAVEVPHIAEAIQYRGQAERFGG